MSDKTPNKSAASGSASADKEPTADVTRVSKPGNESSALAKGTNPAPVKTISDVLSGDRNESAKEGNDTKPAATDTTRNSAGPAVADAKQYAESKPAADARNSPDVKESSDTKGSFAGRVSASVSSVRRNPNQVLKPRVGSGASAADKTEGVTAVSRPMTAGEYARTTNPSASTTAVIPAVRDEAPRSTGAAAAATAASGRQASLKLVRVDPWSVTKVVFALTVALMIVAVVAVTILWIVLSFAGVWDQINSSVTTVLSDDSSSFDITEYLGITRIVGLTLVISAINVVIMTAVATIGAYLYNLAAQLLGGVDITLAEED